MSNLSILEIYELIQRLRDSFFVLGQDALGRKKVSTVQNASPIERFAAKIHIDGFSSCWQWQGSKHKKLGYGSFSGGINANGKQIKTSPHRFIMSYLNGGIPEGLEINHLCCNPSCCNPAHLEIVTHYANIQQRTYHKTHCPSGHEFTPTNTHIMPTGARRCKKCRSFMANRRNKIREKEDPEFAAKRREARKQSTKRRYHGLKQAA